MKETMQLPIRLPQTPSWTGPTDASAGSWLQWRLESMPMEPWTAPKGLLPTSNTSEEVEVHRGNISAMCLSTMPGCMLERKTDTMDIIGLKNWKLKKVKKANISSFTMFAVLLPTVRQVFQLLPFPLKPQWSKGWHLKPELTGRDNQHPSEVKAQRLWAVTVQSTDSSCRSKKRSAWSIYRNRRQTWGRAVIK